MYNQDHHLCQMCDDEPAVYRGLCATCLGEGEEDERPEGRRMKPHYRRKEESEESYHGH